MKSRYFEYWMLFVVLYLLLPYLYAFAVEEECEYNGDPYEDMCVYISYQRVNRHRETKFWAKTSMPGRYTDTYSVISRSEKRDTWKSFPGCCKVKWNETCNLPPKQSESDQYVMIVNLSYKPSFCLNEISENESQPKDKYCEDDTELNCFYKEDDKWYFQGQHIKASTEKSVYKTDYCLFEAPASYLSSGKSTGGEFNLVSEIGDFTLEKNDNKVKWKNEIQNCSMKRNIVDVKSLLKNYTVKRNGHELCWFERVVKIGMWYPTSTCKKSITDDYVPNFILWICIGVAVFVLLILIAAFAIYRTTVKRCFPSYKKTKKEISNNKVFKIDEKQCFLQDATTINNQHTRESADIICNIGQSVDKSANSTPALGEFQKHIDSEFGNELEYISPEELQDESTFNSNQSDVFTLWNINESRRRQNHIGMYQCDHALVHNNNEYVAKDRLENLPTMIRPSPGVDEPNNQPDSGFDNRFDEIADQESQIDADLMKTRIYPTTINDGEYISAEDLLNNTNHTVEHTKFDRKRHTTRAISIESNTSSLPYRCSTSSNDTGCVTESSDLSKTKYLSENDIVHYVKTPVFFDSGSENDIWENETPAYIPQQSYAGYMVK